MMMSSTDVNNHGLGQGWADKELGSTGRLVYSGKAVFKLPDYQTSEESRISSSTQFFPFHI